MGLQRENVKLNPRSSRLGDHRENAGAEVIGVVTRGFAGSPEVVAVPQEPLARLLAELLALMRARHCGNTIHGILHRPIEYGTPKLPLRRVALLTRRLAVCCDLHGVLLNPSRSTRLRDNLRAAYGLAPLNAARPALAEAEPPPGGARPCDGS